MLLIGFSVNKGGFGRKIGVLKLLILEIVERAFIGKRIARNANFIARATSRFLQSIVDANAGKSMLQIDDGVLIFPIGLNAHALDTTAKNTPDTVALGHNPKASIALMTGTLPLLGIDLFGRGILGKLLSKLGNLLANSKH